MNADGVEFLTGAIPRCIHGEAQHQEQLARFPQQTPEGEGTSS